MPATNTHRETSPFLALGVHRWYWCLASTLLIRIRHRHDMKCLVDDDEISEPFCAVWATCDSHHIVIGELAMHWYEVCYQSLINQLIAIMLYTYQHNDMSRASLNRHISARTRLHTLRPTIYYHSRLQQWSVGITYCSESRLAKLNSNQARIKSSNTFATVFSRYLRVNESNDIFQLCLCHTRKERLDVDSWMRGCSQNIEIATSNTTVAWKQQKLPSNNTNNESRTCTTSLTSVNKPQNRRHVWY